MGRRGHSASLVLFSAIMSTDWLAGWVAGWTAGVKAAIKLYQEGVLAGVFQNFKDADLAR